VDDVGVRVQQARALWRRAPGYLTVAAIDGSSVQMGGSAGDVWDLLPEPSSEPAALATLVEVLSNRFGVSADAVARDVDDILDALESLGCVVRIS
jgi:hypothetical protein